MTSARTALAGLVFLAATILAAPAATQERIDFGPFYYLTNEPERLYLDGPIDEGTADWFWRAINSSADLSLLVLDSTDGTSGADALVIADIVRSRHFDTLVPNGSTCDFACSLVYLAGIGRRLDGQFRFSVEDHPDPAVLALMESEMMRFGLSPTLTERVFVQTSGVAPELTPAELATLQRTQEDGLNDIAGDEVPHPTLEVDIENLSELRLVAEPRVATIREFDMDGPTRTVFGQVTWVISDSPTAAVIGAVVAFEEINLLLQIFLYPIVDPQRSYLSHSLTVREVEQFQPIHEVLAVENLRLGPIGAGNTLPMLLLTGAGDQIRQRFFVPRVVARLELERLVSSRQLSFVVAYSRTEGAIISLDMGLAEEQAYMSVLHDWGLFEPVE